MSTEIGLPSRNAKPSSMDPKTSHFPPHPPYFYAHLPSGGEVVAINFITVGDEQYVDDIREFYETDIKEMPEDLADLL